jgi:glucose-6-phosphate dehydrogenase assembly protein OpcA
LREGGEWQAEQPLFSEQVSTVERIRRTAPDIIDDEVTVYDPLALSKPWRVVDHYKKIANVANIRLNYWPCVEQLINQKPLQAPPQSQASK